jgi:hypothetical protein
VDWMLGTGFDGAENRLADRIAAAWRHISTWHRPSWAI